MGTAAYRAQIASQPDAVAAALARTAPRPPDWSRPVIFTGVGSSLHACRIAAGWVTALTGGRLRPPAIDALELVIGDGIRTGDQLVIVSHRGTKTFTNELLATARKAGAHTVFVTGNAVADPPADVVLRTCDDETAGAHTVSYTTALAVLGKLMGTVGGPAATEFLRDLDAAPQAMRETLALPAPVGAARRLVGVEPIVTLGSGVDAVTAQETALKFKESTFAWVEAIGVEVALHGTPACFRRDMAGVLIRPAHDDRGRGREVADFLRALGADVVEVAATDQGAADADVVPFAPGALLTRPLVSVVALQRLVGEVAELGGGDPDTIRGGTEPWASAIAKVRL